MLSMVKTKKKVISKVKALQKQKRKQQVKKKTEVKKAVLKKKLLQKAPVEKKKIVTPECKVALAQLDFLVGDIGTNTTKILQAIEKSRELGAEFVIFPELALTGNPPKDLLKRPDFIDMNMQKFIEVVSACRGIACIVGFVHKTREGIYNAVAVVKDQKILGIVNKRHLDSEIFNEKKYYLEGSPAEVFQIGNKRVGVILCTNLEEESAAVEQLAGKGIDCLVVVSSLVYGRYTAQGQEQAACKLAKRWQVPLVYNTAVGANDQIIFQGSSFLVDKNGLVAARAKKFAEDIVVVPVDASGNSFTPVSDHLGDLYHALLLGIRDYFAKTGFQKAVVGISGGLDSAVTAALAVEALGNDKVQGLFLPSKMTVKESFLDAKRLCANLKIPLKIITIDPFVLPLARSIGFAYEKKNISPTEQNLQARVRAHLLMSAANKEHALVLSTLNKSALAVGYCILYGDTVGTLAPLGDLWKTQIKALAVSINGIYKKKHKRDALPLSILKKEPSAELRPEQRDLDDLPPYDVLDRILEQYVVLRKDIREIQQLGVDPELVRRVASLVQRNAFKREQMPVILHVSSCPLEQLPVVSGWRG